jgi:uncharacterized protein
MRESAIIINHDTQGHQFTTEVDGYGAALDYTLVGQVLTITHTRVPTPIEGRGIAAELTRAALAAARSQGWSVVAACSYARAYLEKHPLESAQQHVDKLLDEALEESFPASDSPSVGGSN